MKLLVMLLYLFCVKVAGFTLNCLNLNFEDPMKQKIFQKFVFIHLLERENNFSVLYDSVKIHQFFKSSGDSSDITFAERSVLMCLYEVFVDFFTIILNDYKDFNRFLICNSFKEFEKNICEIHERSSRNGVVELFFSKKEIISKMVWFTKLTKCFRPIYNIKGIQMKRNNVSNDDLKKIYMEIYEFYNVAEYFKYFIFIKLFENRCVRWPDVREIKKNNRESFENSYHKSNFLLVFRKFESKFKFLQESIIEIQNYPKDLKNTSDYYKKRINLILEYEVLEEMIKSYLSEKNFINFCYMEEDANINEKIDEAKIFIKEIKPFYYSIDFIQDFSLYKRCCHELVDKYYDMSKHKFSQHVKLINSVIGETMKEFNKNDLERQKSRKNLNHFKCFESIFELFFDNYLYLYNFIRSEILSYYYFKSEYFEQINEVNNINESEIKSYSLDIELCSIYIQEKLEFAMIYFSF